MEQSMSRGKELQNVGRKPGNEWLSTYDEDAGITAEVQSTTFDTRGEKETGMG